MADNPRNKSDVETGFRPFSRLAGLIQQAGIELQAPDKPAESKPAAAPALPEAGPEPETDDQLFDRAMEGISRINWQHDPAPASLPSPKISGDAELEEARIMQEVLEGDAAPPILDHPEYIEGWIGIAGRRFLPSLRSGTYSIQGCLDLHGMSCTEAREAVEEFVVRMSRVRSCCVKIVHGRGINSPSDKAVLKEHLQRWLATRRMSRNVVAYASAPYNDGGVGAIYVLLRRNPWHKISWAD